MLYDDKRANYDFVTDLEALDAFNNNGNFKENMKKHLNDEEIENCFNQKRCLKNIDEIFKRFED